MIKTYIGRAMMVSMLEEHQLIDLQDREKIRGYLLPNWNIQALYGLETIKDRYGIPEDPGDMIGHNKRIAEEIDRLRLKSTGEMFPEGMQWIHAFDKKVMEAKANIVWEFSGGSKRGNVRDMLKAILIVVFSQRLIQLSC